ncbi:MAG: hypothetical protein A2150_06515 [Candidatus Muproteobacteria bacterium RBG_16_64_11]|uniref:Radical SAM core domain-containing protein n=1 Tax=Candidatus Muproteobacteria bacterium RBG_16_64_11 TaxID=1817758 RepID=A0A1F6TD85_9PROT|nr:MAG: hypothetical protein A2150_06515 [Candidatus Muproteobacteria bacterium RBG_16_64_11]
MYDAVEQAHAAARIVCQGASRKYHRFRAARFYGGIATADCVGYCLGCVFCWSARETAVAPSLARGPRLDPIGEVAHPERYGRFYAPEEVAGRLVAIARKKHFEQVRISGNEPTICREHLLRVLEQIPPDLRFILETNGILIGADASYAQDLARFANLVVRVSLKGANEAEFARLTGARPENFRLPLAALAHLDRAGVAVHPAVMVSFSSDEAIASLRARLGAIAARFADFEVEELVLYGDVAERLAAAHIRYRTAYTPRSIPPEQV